MKQYGIWDLLKNNLLRVKLKRDQPCMYWLLLKLGVRYVKAHFIILFSVYSWPGTTRELLRSTFTLFFSINVLHNPWLVDSTDASLKIHRNLGYGGLAVKLDSDFPLHGGQCSKALSCSRISGICENLHNIFCG